MFPFYLCAYILAFSPNPHFLSLSLSLFCASNLISHVAELTERDWQLIMSGSSVQTFKKDDVVVEQGSYNRSLYRVKKGTRTINSLIFAIVFSYSCSLLAVGFYAMLH